MVSYKHALIKTSSKKLKCQSSSYLTGWLVLESIVEDRVNLISPLTTLPFPTH